MKLTKGNQRVYRLYSRTYQNIKRVPPRVFAGIFGMATVSFTAAVLVLNSLHVAAITPPLVLGELPYQKLTSQTLTDRAAVLVNVANGNMLLKTSDLNLASAGPGLAVTRYFNSMASGTGQVGSLNTLSVGADVSLTTNSGGSVTFQGPSGFKVTFPSNGSGGYTSPAEYTGAKLATVAGGGWKLTYNVSGDVITFNAAGKQIKYANSAGIGITYAYNANNTLASATDAQGKVTTFTNYSGSKVGKITDPSGRTVQYTYNTSGQLSDVTDTNGKTWHYEYWDGHNVTWIVDPRNFSTTLSYDSSNRVTAINYNDYTAVKTTWTYTYNNGNTVVTDPLLHTTTYTYDASGRVTDTLNAVGDHKGASWDANNNQTAIQDSFSHATTSTFDSLNNMTSRQKPTTAGGYAGAKDTMAYTNAAKPYLPSKTTNAAGNTVSYTYNTYGNVATSTSANAGGTGMGVTTNKYQGDPISGGGTVNCSAKAGQLCSSIDPRGNTTTYGYDTLGNILTVTSPGPVGIKTYTYDSLSRVKTFTDGNNSKVTYTYDNVDRPTLLTYAKDGSTIGYTYDQHGNLTQRTDAAGTTNWTYDGYNRITKIQQTGKSDLNYTYDAAGNLKTEQGPAGTTTYSYDNANQVNRINQPNGANQDFVYNDGKIVTAYLPGNIIQYLTYDNAGRQTSVKAVRNGVTLTDFTGTYLTAANKDSELLQTETDNTTATTTAYTYDGLGRLTGANSTGGVPHSFSYAYDMNGNRTQTVTDGYTQNFTFNAANQQYGTGNNVYTYDNAGNLKTEGASGRALTYNAKNQTTSFSFPFLPSEPPVNASYADAGQTSSTQIGNTVQQNGRLGLYSDTNGSAVSYYTYMPGGLGQVVGQSNGSSYTYFLKDLHNSVVRITDGNGSVVTSYTYDPYGKFLSTSSYSDNPWLYASGYMSRSTGSNTYLYKFGARYYNHEDGRWTQLDPSGAETGYVYAGANPVNFNDPTGYAPCLYGLSAASSGCAAGFPAANPLPNDGTASRANLQCVGGSIEAGAGGATFFKSLYDYSKAAQSSSKAAPGGVAIGLFGLSLVGQGIALIGTC